MVKHMKLFCLCILVAAALTAYGCKQDGPLTCDDDTAVKCQCDDGSIGESECVDGVPGECICEPPANDEGCAIQLADAITDNMTVVANCTGSAEGDYAQCVSIDITINNKPAKGVKCQKVFEDGTIYSSYYPFFSPDDYEDYSCLLLNDVCCASNSSECAATDNGTDNLTAMF